MYSAATPNPSMPAIFNVPGSCFVGPSLKSTLPLDYNGLCRAAHNAGLKVVVDACQTIGTHDFDPFTVDYAVFSGHKMYGPTGVGILYGRLDWSIHRAILQGGDKINHYDFSGNVDFKEGPTKQNRHIKYCRHTRLYCGRIHKMDRL